MQRLSPRRWTARFRLLAFERGRASGIVGAAAFEVTDAGTSSAALPGSGWGRSCSIGVRHGRAPWPSGMLAGSQLDLAGTASAAAVRRERGAVPPAATAWRLVLRAGLPAGSPVLPAGPARQAGSRRRGARGRSGCARRSPRT